MGGGVYSHPGLELQRTHRSGSVRKMKHNEPLAGQRVSVSNGLPAPVCLDPAVPSTLWFLKYPYPCNKLSSFFSLL